MHPWLVKLRHDLVKRCVWPARDLRDSGQAPHAADVRALRAGLCELPDAEGRPVAATALWTALLEEAPAGALREPAIAAAVQRLGSAVAQAQAAVEGLAHSSLGPSAHFSEALRAVLEIEACFDALARELKSFS